MYLLRVMRVRSKLHVVKWSSGDRGKKQLGLLHACGPTYGCVPSLLCSTPVYHTSHTPSLFLIAQIYVLRKISIANEFRLWKVDHGLIKCFLFIDWLNVKTRLRLLRNVEETILHYDWYATMTRLVKVQSQIIFYVNSAIA